MSLFDRSVELLLSAIALYAAAGLVFAAAFLTAGLRRVDAVAAASGWGVRVTLLPGVVALWPVLARKWIRGTGGQPPSDAPVAPRTQRATHGLAAKSLAVVVPIVLGAGLAFREAPPRAVASIPGAAPITATTASTKLEFDALPLELTISRSAADPAPSLTIRVMGELADPPLLVYWDRGRADEGVTPDAVFVGSIASGLPRRFPLPAASLSQYGDLVFYSLSAREVAARAPLPPQL